MTDDDKSLGDQHTFDGDSSGKSGDDILPDDLPHDGGETTGPSSLGDELTFSGDEFDISQPVLGESVVDDEMPITELDTRYTIEGNLGKGGMGEVQLATDTLLNRKVAIKRVLGKAARSTKAWQRFKNGAKTIAKLNHPNIVQVYEFGRSQDGPFMILECVTGGSLFDRCQQGPIPLEEAINITCQLCDGIGKAHAAGIIHRDIKPANVLMTEDGIPKLNDFDLAKAETADTEMTMAGAVLGTLDFMPPEQRQDAALVDQRSDLWSLAATLYQMVTGKSPKIIRFTDVPSSLHAVLEKALEDEKDDRYQSAAEFKDALSRIAQHKTETPRFSSDLAIQFPDDVAELGGNWTPEDLKGESVSKPLEKDDADTQELSEQQESNNATRGCFLLSLVAIWLIYLFSVTVVWLFDLKRDEEPSAFFSGIHYTLLIGLPILAVILAVTDYQKEQPDRNITGLLFCRVVIFLLVFFVSFYFICPLLVLLVALFSFLLWKYGYDETVQKTGAFLTKFCSPIWNGRLP